MCFGKAEIAELIKEEIALDPLKYFFSAEEDDDMQDGGGDEEGGWVGE